MNHLSEESLADIALSNSDPVDPLQNAHLLDCALCGRAVAELRRIVSTGRAGKPYPLREPSADLLTQIRAQLNEEATQDWSRATDPTHGRPGLGSPADPGAPVGLSSVGLGRRSRRRVARGSARAGGVEPRRAGPPSARRTPRVLAAAAAVAVVLVGSAVWYRLGVDEAVVARAVMQPLPSRSGQGTAQLIERDGARELSIELTRPAVSGAFEELWLLNTDGRRMISLGIVPPDGRGRYPVPLDSRLDGYTVVDVSLEPFDGNAAHSRTSLLRGTLN